MKNTDIVDFIFEMAMLRRIRHEGWRVAGVENPDSVAEHTLRAAQIGYFLAKMENHDPKEVVILLVFHDTAETRTGDVHRIASRYVEKNEEKAVKDQTKLLGEAGNEILSIWSQTHNKDTTAGVIAKDADLLEQAFTAKEYMELGHKSTKDWIKNIKKKLKTKSAMALLKELKKKNSTDWWKGLKKHN